MKRAKYRISTFCLILVAFCLCTSFPSISIGQEVDATALYLINSNGKWGYSDRNGNIVIRPQFAMGGFFDHGTAEVWLKDNSQRLVDTRGNIIEYRNFASNHFSEEVIPVSIEGKYGFADRQGKLVIFPHFEAAGDFSEGLAPVRSGGKWGYIDHNGRFVIKPQFSEAKNFSDGIAVIRLFTKRSSTNGDYGTFTDLGKGTHDYGFINKAGDVVIASIWDNAGEFSNGLAPVCAGDHDQRKCGYIDASGKVAIALKFDKANSFSEGLASVKFGSKFGYVDTSGSVVIAPIFETAFEFEDGLAYAAFGRTSYHLRHSVLNINFHGKVGYIDKTGRFLPKPLSWNS